MIQAIKNDSLTTLQVMTLSIRIKELELHKDNFKLMGITSALIAGFAYGEISTPTWNQYDNTLVMRLAYLAATTASMGLGLIIIVISSFSAIFGVGLALRGD